ncbi:conserved hypothetical protein [Neorickettsia risticii str. Illinois]|uniref:Uncharacterized protein n=1 Tax=Neorickettsia risticii (strain Illinois) TaxID=434131 RepID=C6V3Q2_NEORI|nr:conserved hypothetical protein [Neorickettsia risticii str. Illinois]
MVPFAAFSCKVVCLELDLGVLGANGGVPNRAAGRIVFMNGCV